ncbi:TPA: hypothetical protein J8T82_002559 [Enterococcus faecium]|nr:hypothetical protein [Enterococcus faecium]
MLKISYKPSTDSKEMKKEYETVNDFLQGQYLDRSSAIARPFCRYVNRI